MRHSYLDMIPAETAERIRQLSIRAWGAGQAVVLIGRDPAHIAAVEKVTRFGQSDSPVLITGETGTGKELFARALFLASDRMNKPFLRVNCAQYTGDHLVVSELFGHKKGSFTGAVGDHRGIFEEAEGGAVFLDEIGELPLAAQAMLLRLLSEREIVPVGGSHPRLVNVRVVVATNRDLNEMVVQGRFRADLLFRLRCLQVHITPLRERGDDWELIARHYLDLLSHRYGRAKRLTTEALRALQQHAWPGNVREVKSCVETGFHMSQGDEIVFADLAEALESSSRADQFRRIPYVIARDECALMMSGERNFWELVYRPFMNRDLSRADVRAIIAEGLKCSDGSYKRLVDLVGIAESDYLKFMDFLRHHDLKPEPAHGGWGARSARSSRPQDAAEAEAQ